MSLFKKLFGLTLSGGDKLTLPAADGAANQVWKTDGNGNIDWVTQTGDAVIFGSEYHSATDDTVDTSSATGFTQKLRLTTASVVAGDYYIGWNYQWNYDSLQRDFIGRVQLDDTTDLMNHVAEPADAGSGQAYQLSGFDIVTLTAGIHDVDIDWAASSGSDVAAINDARLILYRVS